MNQRSGQNDFAQALAAHRAGQYSVAENLYRRILRDSPDNAQVLCMLGTLACATGRMESGVTVLQRAVSLDPRQSAAQFNLAQALEQLGRLEEARQGYERVVQMAPQDAEASLHAGRLHMRCGMPERAVDHYRKAVQLRPDMAQFHNLLGIALRVTGNHEDAIAAYLQAVRLSPGSADMHCNLGIALHAAGRIFDALAAFDTAARLDPTNADMQSNLGHLLRLSGKTAQALTVLERAESLDPQHPGIQVNLANTLLDLNRATESLPHYARALAARPQEADFHASYGMALESLGREEEALNEYRAALTLDAGHPDALFSLGLHALSQHGYAEGWQGYEYRWSRRSVACPLRRFAQPRWQGEPLQEKRLLIHAEQGIGDEIMFASIFPELLREAAHCVIECTPKVESLFRNSFPTASIVATDRDHSDWFVSSPAALAHTREIDLQIPAGSLPSLRRRSRQDFPPHHGYLRADESRVAHWQSRLAMLGPGLKVGLSWRGGTPRTGIVRRSLSLPQLLPLLQVPNVHFISVQYTPCGDELAELTARTGTVIHHWQEAIDDYGETAALLCALDLTISVCTSVIHLGGALGRAVWVMAPKVPEWRYGRVGEDMPWYPTVRIFRNDEPEDWRSVIERVAAELSLQGSQ